MRDHLHIRGAHPDAFQPRSIQGRRHMNTTRAAIETSTLSDETRKAGFWRRRGHQAAAEAQAEIREAEKALDRALDDAEPLLGYLVESGVQLGDEEKAAVARIIAARLSRDTAWT